jgi:phospholipid/cholesterol/gamma-HCH transport system substrate-binding protein
MRLLVPVLLVIVAAVAVVLLTRDGEEPYKVRAIFDNAGFVIPGEDVKVAGVKVGKIDALDVTKDFKAAVVLRIDDPAYQDFRRDAECTIRPQSLIGERFVECEPSQPRQATAPKEPALEKIDDGAGKGQYLLPVENTSKPVDLDLLNDITREPQRARLSIILSELGTGVAGRGSDLNEVIRRANPALKEVDKVLEILASENTTLQKLAVDGDTVLAPLARERRHVSSAIANSAEVAEATAERSDQLEADIQRLPAFLRELRPTMERLGGFADQATPVLSDLHAQAPAINRLLTDLGPFSEAGIPAVDSLGEAAKVGIPAVKASRPIIHDLRVFAKQVRPLGATAAKLLGSVQSQRGFERVMDYIFYQVAAVNGFDSFGHYLRAGLIVNQCSTYVATPTPGCTANFPNASATAATSGASAPSDPILKATAEAIARALRGETGSKRTSAKSTPTPDSVPKLRATPSPSPSPAPAASATPAPTPAAPAATPAPAPPASTDEPLLDFLFGKDAG